MMKQLYFAHKHAIVESTAIGPGTRIWAFAHVLPGARIGSDCNICDHVFIENDVIVGDRVTIKSGVQLWDGVRLEDDVFVGPNATFTNDPFPRSRQRPPRFLQTVVKAGASIGANATILPGLCVGERALVSAACVISRDVPANAIVLGNPARIVGYVDSETSRASLRPVSTLESDAVPPKVRGVTLHRFTKIDDLRGSLIAGEDGSQVPFPVRRFFLVYDVNSEHVRGEHAHRELHQLLVCVRGRVNVMLDDGENREVMVLDSPTVGVHIPPLVWSSQYKYTSDAMLLVLASSPYDPGEYVRDYNDFRALVRRSLNGG